MVQGGGGFSFEFKPCKRGFAGKLAVQQQLESDDAIQANLARFPNHSHASASDLADELVISKLFGGLGGRAGFSGGKSELEEAAHAMATRNRWRGDGSASRAFRLRARTWVHTFWIVQQDNHGVVTR